MTLPTWPQLISAGWSLLYPSVCQLCGENRAEPTEGYVCRSCRDGVKFIEPPFCAVCGLPAAGQITHDYTCSNCREQPWDFSSARGATVAEGAIREAIHRYKYHRALWFEPFLCQYLLERALPELQGQAWDAVVPVPLYPVKEREREFNQAERLGRQLALALQIPLQTRWVKRVEPTEQQARLSRKDRLANMRRAFAPATETKIPGARIVVVDDVLTTGATTSAVAAVLKDLGADTVCVWAVARAVS